MQNTHSKRFRTEQLKFKTITQIYLINSLVKSVFEFTLRQVLAYVYT